MATLVYHLKNPNGKKETVLYAILYVKDKQIKVSTGFKMKPSEWNQKKQCKRGAVNDVDIDNFNTTLNNARKRITERYKQLSIESGTLPHSDVIDVLRGVFQAKLKSPDKKIFFVDFAEDYQKKCGKKPWTRKHYLTTINVLKDYEKHIKKRLSFEDIDIAFYNDFVHWCEKKDMAVNTIGSHIKEIKVFMNYANDTQTSDHTGHLHKKFRVIEEESDTIYLNMEEISAIYSHHFEDTYMDKIRDVFIIGCMTGLRYSNLVNLTKDMFLKDNTILKVKTEKTGEIVYIPLHNYVKEIYDKYDGHIPGPYTDQYINRQLKIIAKNAGIKERITKTITRGGKRKTVGHMKYELVSVHTARRSFATNAFLANIPLLSIAKITGHKSIKSLLKYIKVSNEQNAELLSKHEFFNLSNINES